MRYLIFSVLFLASQLFAFDASFWSDIQKYPVPKYRIGEQVEGVKAQSIFFEGELYKGNPTEVFAFYCTPSMLKGGKASDDKNLPAVVCVHGGGGRAFEQWVQLWASKGYAAIAVNWRGNGPEKLYKNPTPEQKKKINPYLLNEGRVHLKNGGPEHTHQTTSLDDGKAERDAWAYHAVGAIVRAHSLIRSFKEVDENRTAITGISWGGYLTSLVSAIDTRFKVAVPVYGCGYICDFRERWRGSVGKDPVKTKRWIEVFEPSQSLKVAKVPMLFLNAPTDYWYPLSIWTRSAELPKNAQTLLVAGFTHGHHEGWSVPEIEEFIASKINGKPPFLKLSKLVVEKNIASCKVSDAKKMKSAKLFYTTTNDILEWHKFKWESVNVKNENGRLSAEIPTGSRAVYISITDTFGRRITTNAKILIP